MLPDNKLSVEPEVAEWRFSASFPVGNNFFFTEGGYELGNPLRGITGQVWRARVKDNKFICIQSLNYQETVVHIGEAITFVSMAFDVNMNYYLCFIDKGECFISWFNESTGTRDIISIGSNVVTPILELDDKRTGLNVNADVILSYIKDNKLYHRLQRDGYAVERLLDDGPFIGISKVGLNRLNRFQYKLIPLTVRDIE